MLSSDDSQVMIEKMDSISLFSKTFRAKLLKLCSDQIFNMELVGTLGLQKIVPLRNALTVQDMVDNSVKVWLLSQYSQRKTMTNCMNLNILEDT